LMRKEREKRDRIHVCWQNLYKSRGPLPRHRLPIRDNDDLYVLREVNHSLRRIAGQCRRPCLPAWAREKDLRDLIPASKSTSVEAVSSPSRIRVSMRRLRATLRCRSTASRSAAGMPFRSPLGWTATAKHSALRKSLTRLARRIAIEVPRGALVETLAERGFPVFSINPKQLDRFRDRYSPAGAKDDSRDTFVLADSLARIGPVSRPGVSTHQRWLRRASCPGLMMISVTKCAASTTSFV
jgi:Transposase